MNLNRRHFLQISGLTSLGVVTGFNSLSQVFDVIPHFEQDFIPVIGIFPDPNSIKPGGIHLRWALPPAKGIPEEITIYRRKGTAKGNTILLKPGLSGRSSFPSSYDQVKFSGPLNSFKLEGIRADRHYQFRPGSARGMLKIIFSQKVNYCNISLGNVSPLTAKAYYEDGTVCHEVVSEGNPSNTRLTFRTPEGRPFRHIEIPADFEFFYSLDFNGPKYMCESDGWQEIEVIDNDKDVSKNSLFRRLNKDVQNYYVGNSADLLRYENLAKRYAALIKLLEKPSDQFFLPDSSYPSLEETPPCFLNLRAKNGSDAKINAWNLLMFDSIDPNSATMLGLYFVDKTAKNPSEIYDYKIEAKYSTKLYNGKLCGVVLGIGGRYSAMPALQGILSGTQAGKTWWEFDKDFKETQFGKVRVTWPVSTDLTEQENWMKYADHVVYDLKSDGQSRLIVPQKEKTQLVFLDQRVRMTATQRYYALKGVDLFGRISNDLSCDLKMLDKDFPPAPVKLNFLNHGEEGKMVDFRFEYGAYQYLTDPKIKRFFIFQKNGSVYHNNLKLKYHSFIKSGQTPEGMDIYELTLATNVGISYQNLFFVEDYNGKRLPAAKRKKFHVDRLDQNKVTFISEIDFVPDPNGTIMLEADIKDKVLGWNLLRNFNIEFKNPKPCFLNSYVHYVRGSGDGNQFGGADPALRNGFHARVEAFYHKEWSADKDLFGSNELETSNISYTEIFLSRSINEADIFTGGKILIGSQSHSIMAQNAGKKSCCIVVSGHVNVSAGNAAYLFMPAVAGNPEGYIAGFMILNMNKEATNVLKDSGELLLRGTKNYKIEKNSSGQNAKVVKEVSEVVNVVAVIYSDLSDTGDTLQVLVKISKKISFLHAEQNARDSGHKALYFEPYSVDFTDIVGSIPLGISDAFTTSHFSVAAADTAGHESPLSTIAQFIKTRSKHEKPVTPEKPFPCVQPTATKAYLGLPNALGNSTFCLGWRGNSQLRYEIGRASDKSIVAAHRYLWLSGLRYETDANEEIDRVNFSTFTSPNSNTGIIDAVWARTEPFDKDKYLGGRLLQVNGTKTNYFEIVSIKAVSGGQYNVGLRAVIKGATMINSPCKIQKLPDYQLIHDSDELLTRLANLRPPVEMPDLPDGLGAFSLITGQPLRNTLRYLDEAQGQGKSRFFYKVRAVDASENRSLWSPASVPVWQMDTAAPDAPVITSVEQQNKIVYLRWRNEMDKKISGYEIYQTKRSPGMINQPAGVVKKIASLSKYGDSGNAAMPAKIRYRYGAIEYPQIALLNDSSKRITGIFKLTTGSVPDTSINYLITAVTSLQNNVISNLHPEIRNGVQVVVVLNSNVANKELVVYSNVGELLVTRNGEVSIPSNLQVNVASPLKGIFEAKAYDMSRKVEEQEAKNYNIQQLSSFLVQGVIKGPYSGLMDNESVVLQLTKSDDQAISYLKEYNNEYEFEVPVDVNGDYEYLFKAIKLIPLTPPAKVSSKLSKAALIRITNDL